MNGKSNKRAGDTANRQGWRPSVRQVGWAIVVVVAVLFVVLNNDKAEVNLIVASPRWPMWTLVVASMAIAFVLAKLTRGRRGDD